MDLKERDQCNHKDRFWGIDHENKLKINNQKLMEKEHRLSLTMELYHKDLAQQQQWEDEYLRQTESDAYYNALDEEQKRMKYMKHLFKSNTSEAVCSYKWIKPTGTSQIIPEEAYSVPNKGGRNSNIGNKYSRPSHFDPTLDILNPDFVGNQTMFHLEGIQQARALSLDSIASADGGNNVNESSTLGPILRGRATTPGIAQDKMMSIVDDGDGVPNTNIKNNIDGGTSKSVSQGQNGSFLSMFGPDVNQENGGNGNGNGGFAMSKTIKKKKEITDEMKRSSQAYDGHPYYKWDQELILREVFDSLDSEQEGLLNPEHLAKLSSSLQLQYLLSFTVYGSWIKRKRWDLFLNSLFNDNNNSNDNSNNNNNGSPNANANANNTVSITSDNIYTNTINIQKWFRVALQLSKEKFKSIRHIRTENEHLESLTYDNNFHSLDGNSRNFAENARLLQDIASRDALVLNTLDIGDVVWGLHDGGCKWLPAVIEEINYDNLTYTLKYCLSQSQLRSARKKRNGTEILSGKRIHKITTESLVKSVYPSHKLDDKKVIAMNAVFETDSSEEMNKALNSIFGYNIPKYVQLRG
jgi:hypothetical protein